jgi:hypothetical protein
MEMGNALFANRKIMINVLTRSRTERYELNDWVWLDRLDIFSIWDIYDGMGI